MTAWATHPADTVGAPGDPGPWIEAANIGDRLVADLLDIAQGQVAAYAPPIVEATGESTTRRNRLQNPLSDALPIVATGWTGSGMNLTPGAGFLRGTLVNGTATNLAQFAFTPSALALPYVVTVTPGAFYAISCQARCSTPGASLSLLAVFYDAAGVGLTSYASAPTPASGTEFVELAGLMLVAPPLATHLSIRWGIAGTTPRTIGDTVDARRVMIEPAAKRVGDYFDGETLDTSHAVHTWDSTPGLSGSKQLTTADIVPPAYRMAVVLQARDVWQASRRVGDSVAIGEGQYAIRVRPLSDTVKALLRPPTGVPGL